MTIYSSLFHITGRKRQRKEKCYANLKFLSVIPMTCTDKEGKANLSWKNLRGAKFCSLSSVRITTDIHGSSAESETWLLQKKTQTHAHAPVKAGQWVSCTLVKSTQMDRWTRPNPFFVDWIALLPHQLRQGLEVSLMHFKW